MNKEKLAAAKQKIRKYAPLASTLTGLAATVYAIYIVRNATETVRWCADNTIKLTADDREELKTEDTHLVYSIDGSDYRLGYIGNTPKK